MSIHIPSDIANIILEYYAQMRDMKWTPCIDTKTGKLKWKVNKYSNKYFHNNRVLKYRKNNPRYDINIILYIIRNAAYMGEYRTMGTCIYLQTVYHYQRNDVVVPVHELYIEFYDENNVKCSVFCSITENKLLFKGTRRIYIGDDTKFGILRHLAKRDEHNYSIYLDKY
jgi:hypothetical protein